MNLTALLLTAGVLSLVSCCLAQDQPAPAPVHTHVLNGLCPACPEWTTTADYAQLEKGLFALADGTAVTAENWPQKRAEIGQRILATFGPFPEKVALEPQVLQEDEYQGLTRRKVSYQVETGERVPAWLLLPAGCDLTKPHPAILCAHQTIEVGKDEPIGAGGTPHLNYALQMTRDHGYITLTPDYLTAGERVVEGMKPYFTDDFYRRHPQWSMFGKSLWDSMRAVDYLQSLPFVDPDKIGMMGHSLGGCTTAIACAFEERLKVGVESCGGLQLFQANWQYALEYSRTGWYIYCPSLREHFLKETTPWDVHELYALIAPRPYMQTGAFNDGNNPNPLDKVRTAELVRKAYKLLGVEDNFNLYMHHGTHGFPSVAVDQGVQVLNRVLRGPDRP